MNKIILQPQPGPQAQFLSTSADIAILGGAAGGGKTFGLLLEPIRHLNNKLFTGVIFRRTTKQIRAAGGLWSQSNKIYSLLNGIPREGPLDWTFPSKMRLQFAHLEHESNVSDWQGTEVPFIGFEELTHFTERQFFYMLSRNRSTSGVPGYVRATTNPDYNSWVKRLIQWWINPKTGFAIPERSGVLRWFVRREDQIIWGNSRKELVEQYGELSFPKSLTFIPANVYDNKILMEKDPNYLANLMALPKIDREQLLNANWNVQACAGMFFQRRYFEVVDATPADMEIVKIVRCWDRAATKVDDENSGIRDPKNKNKDPDYTVGCKMAKLRSGHFLILDIIRVRLSTFEVEKLILNTAKQDGINVTIKIFQDPGSAGVYEKESTIRMLAGFNVEVEKVIRDKITSAKPLSAQSEAGNVRVLRGKWNESFFSEAENFPDVDHDDQIDAASGAFNLLNFGSVGEFTEAYEQDDYQDNFNSEELSW